MTEWYKTQLGNELNGSMNQFNSELWADMCSRLNTELESDIYWRIISRLRRMLDRELIPSLKEALHDIF